jgi:hypothetical protein
VCANVHVRVFIARYRATSPRLTFLDAQRARHESLGARRHEALDEALSA